MSFTTRFELPNFNDDEIFGDCDTCPKKEICHKLSYCIQEDYE